MVALPTSLRRTMIMLLVVMSTVVMVFYWNQTSIKPLSFTTTTFEKSSKSNPPEKTWTYKCYNDKCIREHYINNAIGSSSHSANNNNINKNNNNNNGNLPTEKRTPFLTCAMVCGEPNIWPLPTKKIILGSQSLTFGTDNIKININTKFQEVASLMNDAYLLFLKDLKNLENNLRNNDNDNNNIDSKDNTDKLNNNNGNGNEQQHEKPSSSSSSSSSSSHHHDDNRNKYCDIKDIDLEIIISKYEDIVLVIDTDESYELIIKSEAVSSSTLTIKIIANSFFGARHALTTLEQLIWYDDEDNLLRILNSAHIEDEPKFRYRGLMMDTSRHYFSVESIKRTLIGMSHSKLNRFHWHITDSQSFPYVSKAYPQLAKYGAYSNHEVYTYDDIKDIVNFARVRGIQIIPEIDAPAHSGNGWDFGVKHGLGELSLCINQQPWSYYCGEPPCGQLNPKNNNTYMILETLYSELLELAGPLDYFHLGGDEVNLECWAQYFNDTDLKGLWCDFMLQAFRRLKKANKNVAPRFVAVWSSGLTSSYCLSKNSFAVQVWGGSTWQENYDLLMNGYNILISHVDAWYLDCGFGSWRSTGEGACSPYTTWQHVYKHRPWDKMHIEQSKMKQILGGEACLWSEQVDENILDSRLWPRTSALAERLWSDPIDESDIENVNKNVFNRMSIFRNRLVDYGLKAEPIFPKYCGQNQDECM